jgi:hypothetical protein
LIGTLLRQVVAMIDAVEILMCRSAVHAASLQLRALFEASVYIEWMLGASRGQIVAQVVPVRSGLKLQCVCRRMGVRTRAAGGLTQLWPRSMSVMGIFKQLRTQWRLNEADSLCHSSRG